MVVVVPSWWRPRRQDMDNVVRLCLEQLGAPQRACAIIRETRSSNGAREIAKYSQASNYLAAKPLQSVGIKLEFGLQGVAFPPDTPIPAMHWLSTRLKVGQGYV